jgi:hypothetical protein
MKTHIIRNTRIGVSNIASVWAQKTTTWALDMAQEDKLQRLEIFKKGAKADKALVEYMTAEGLTPSAIEDYFAKLADTYNICLK